MSSSEGSDGGGLLTGGEQSRRDVTPREVLSEGSDGVPEYDGQVAGMDLSEGSDKWSTLSPLPRHYLTNDALSLLLVGSLIAVVFAGSTGFLDPSTLPRSIRDVYVLSVAVSVVWAFGRDAFKVWRERGGAE